MSTQALSQIQKDQLRQMLDECGLKNVHLEIGDILMEGLEETKGIPSKKLTEKQNKLNKKMTKKAYAEELAAKIKATHGIDVVPSEFTQTALKKILSTGKLQEKKKAWKPSKWQNFLAHERIENKKLDNQVSGKEVLKLASVKWAELTTEEKSLWKNVQPEKPTAEEEKPTAEKPTAEEEKPTAEKPTAEEENEEVESKKSKKKSKKMNKKQMIEHLSDEHGWDEDELSNYNVPELRQALETGELPTEEMEARKKKKKATKKKKTTKKKATKEPEPEPEPNSESKLNLFDMSEDEDDEDDEE
jgi:hypothetical protein